MVREVTLMSAEEPVANDELKGRAAALPAHWPALRELLQWRGADGAIEPAPALVQIKKCD